MEQKDEDKDQMSKGFGDDVYQRPSMVLNSMSSLQRRKDSDDEYEGGKNLLHKWSDPFTCKNTYNGIYKKNMS